MKKNKMYRYKIHVEIERIELDAKGNEKPIAHEQGELFGIDGVEVYRFDDFGEPITIEQIIKARFDHIVKVGQAAADY